LRVFRAHLRVDVSFAADLDAHVRVIDAQVRVVFAQVRVSLRGTFDAFFCKWFVNAFTNH
jgi:hypothetical protein